MYKFLVKKDFLNFTSFFKKLNNFNKKIFVFKFYITCMNQFIFTVHPNALSFSISSSASAFGILLLS